MGHSPTCTSPIGKKAYIRKKVTLVTLGRLQVSACCPACCTRTEPTPRQQQSAGSQQVLCALQVPCSSPVEAGADETYACCTIKVCHDALVPPQACKCGGVPYQAGTETFCAETAYCLSLRCRYEYDGVPEHIHAYRETPRTGNVGPPEWVNPPKPDFSDSSKRRMDRCAADPASCVRKVQWGDFDKQPRRNLMEDFDAGFAESASQFASHPTCNSANGAWLVTVLRSGLCSSTLPTPVLMPFCPFCWSSH
jgi:hypothetical protein